MSRALPRMKVYYNDNDPFCVEWLKKLIEFKMIADGDIDNRSIRDVTGSDLRGYTQCHFFAGIGGWSYALRLAGVPDDYPVWTGSCPCQPFSVAGKRRGTKDERHLWPEFRRLISERNPPTVFGEQVASKDGRLWLSGVRADLEALGYAVGGADLCAAGVGAPHIRQRLYWVADNQRKGLEGCTGREVGNERQATERDSEAGGMGFPDSTRSLQGRETSEATRHGNTPFSTSWDDRRLSNSLGNGEIGNQSEHGNGRGSVQTGPWSDYILIPCADGKARRIEPGLMPLAHGIPNRVGLIRGYGNAIVPQVAEVFIRSFFEVRQERLFG